MSDPQPPLTRTPAREDALKDVVLGLISYDPIRAVYLKGSAPVSGPKRRTLSELRQYEYIDKSDPRKVAKVVLTEAGEALAIEWGLKNPPSAEEVVEAESVVE